MTLKVKRKFKAVYEHIAIASVSVVAVFPRFF